MIIEPLGDSAFILRDLRGPAFAVADAITELNVPEIVDVNASYETVGVYSSPGALSPQSLTAVLEKLVVRSDRLPRRHKVPVLYDGEDLETVAQQLGLTRTEVAHFHSGVEYTCFAVGFCPGYPYLGWLPKELQGIPRKASPRTRTEPGSVALTGKQTGIYSLPTPGGWSIIGRTPLTIVDVDDDYFPIRAGDLVSFFEIGEREFLKLKGERL